MSFQGKQLPPEMVEAVVRLKKHYDEERKAGKFVSTMNPAKRTADSLGIGEATVKRIMADYGKNEDRVVYTVKQRPGRPPSGICPVAQPIVRKFVREANLLGQRVSVEKVRRFLNSEHRIDIPKMTLWRALGRWGFGHGEGRRRNSLREQERINSGPAGIPSGKAWKPQFRRNLEAPGSLRGRDLRQPEPLAPVYLVP